MSRRKVIRVGFSLVLIWYVGTDLTSSAAVPGLARGGPYFGIHSSNSLIEVAEFERWLGRRVDFVNQHTGRRGWQDYENSVGWAAELLKPLARPVLWSIPLIPEGAHLEEAAAGKYNEIYIKLAKELLERVPRTGSIMVRTGWEFNGDWQPWASFGREQVYIAAYRQFVDSFRGTSDRFRFEWNVNVGGEVDPALSYPGDQYVDIIGMDFYHHAEWDIADPLEAWDDILSRPFGLLWHRQFAQRHGKRTAYPEWGVMLDNFGPYVQKVAEWFADPSVAYHAYWESNGDYEGQLRYAQYPATAEAFRASFGSR